MHAIKDEGHREQVAVLEADDVPLVLRGGFVGVDVGEQAEGEDDDPQVHPHKKIHDIDGCRECLSLELGLNEGPSEGYYDVAHVVDDQDHHPRCDLVAHHGEEDEAGSHAVVEQKLVELALGFPLDDHHLED